MSRFWNHFRQHKCLLRTNEIQIDKKGKTKYIIDWKNAYEFIENTYNVFGSHKTIIFEWINANRKARDGSTEVR